MQKQTKNSILVFLAVFAVISMSRGCVEKASAQTVISGIQKMSGWQSCGACAGTGGNGPNSSNSMIRFIKSPSLSGASAQFNISSSTAFADALWWKQLGPRNAATSFVYDLFFYIKNPTASQALEFDVNQANGKHRWVFGTQCNIAGGHWDVWANAAGHWKSTGVHCSPPTAFKWHHLVWEFKRTATQVIFVAFTYDGVKHYINRTYPAKASSTNELNVAYQMDMTSSHKAYSTWVDNVTLKYR